IRRWPGGHAGGLQAAHGFVGGEGPGPGTDTRVQLRLVGFAPERVREALVGRPGRIADRPPEAGPLFLAGDAQRDPLIFAPTRVTAVWREDRVPITAANGQATIHAVVEQRFGDAAK